MKYILSLAMISLIAFSTTLSAQVMLPEEQEERVPSETFDYENTYHGDEESEVLREEQQEDPSDHKNSAWNSAPEEANPEIYQDDAYLE
ncbi:MAG TPA: hypothetical protein VNJ01_07605 [Bacteriovoracaceae bacterium]|nr:hypothetical protein [Bacteriovoracaceae bacterium]